MSEPAADPWPYEPVPNASVRLFRMAWQLETWLRTMVYVELRASRLDWEEPIKAKAGKWPPPSKQSDKRLHHMATPHQAAISYLTFGQLWAIIADAVNWPLFEPYFPPKENVAVRIEEVKAIRNRLAHFREPHPTDDRRMKLFMEDMEPGIRSFCARYSVSKYIGDDPVSEILEKSWRRVGYSTELYRPDHKWLYASGRYRDTPKMNARLEILTHQNYKAGASEGLIYRLSFGSHRQGSFDFVNFFRCTAGLHKDIIHILLSSLALNGPTITIPAIHGPESTAELIGQFLLYASDRISTSSSSALNRARLKWPEYVLWPDHMLTFFDDSMREPVLDLD